MSDSYYLVLFNGCNHFDSFDDLCCGLLELLELFEFKSVSVDEMVDYENHLINCGFEVEYRVIHLPMLCLKYIIHYVEFCDSNILVTHCELKEDK